MAVFSKLVTTEKGKELIAHMLSSGEQITFTKVRSSDMEYPLEELKGLEALEGIRQTGIVLCRRLEELQFQERMSSWLQR